MNLTIKPQPSILKVCPNFKVWRKSKKCVRVRVHVCVCVCHGEDDGRNDHQGLSEEDDSVVVV